jgi:PKD repeat protein
MNNRKISLVIFLIMLSCFSSLYSQIPFSEQKVITDTDLSANVYACDLDGDGDMDVLSAVSSDQKIVWYENSMPPVTHFSADLLFGSVPLTVQFTDSSRGGRTAWLWDFGDGNTSTEQNPVHTYHTADTFAVSLTVTGKQGSDTETRENYIIVTDPSVITGKGEQVPVSFALSQNYPNPFNPSTQIEYDVKTSCKVNLFIYNLHGQIVKKFVNSLQQPGKYAINVNLQDIPSGIYFYKIVMGDFQAVKKMVKIE